VAESSRYVLITPARDEAATIGQVIAAVRAQVITPRRWIIVDDASVDGTADVVEEHIADVDWIRLVRHDAGSPADFAAKVYAFGAGLRHLDGVEYDFIGNLDADILVEPDYFARVLRVFQERPRLGIAGGRLVEEYGGRRVPQRISANSVAGAVQLFRRRAFEDIGGLQPMRLGGEDSVAEILARMRGWEVATLFDIEVRHQGQVLSLSKGPLAAWFTRGVLNRSLGYAPSFQAAVSVYRAAVQSPYGLTGAAMFAGYVSAAARRVAPALDAETVAFLRTEQRRRLLGMLGIRRESARCAG
jgi:glycosyltransferase involved in cell wall biosynthesis